MVLLYLGIAVQPQPQLNCFAINHYDEIGKTIALKNLAALEKQFFIGDPQATKNGMVSGILITSVCREPDPKPKK